ncbi:hypothetical protein DFA_10373 [Cavenderia fasciculata]|uniref:Ankyrin repeat-containing protein n=1 Tax=Cavenderia fasciculata TaxID=261658 RepID=F4QA12_CACFS|nr:uncharacterized protein DFA_10373 [Cavenderia fasciculata]EGG15531.1 hypothetical protein DFA_10373 [Cavenderia fasciculata]|eukprot:XP_004354273.1 hypothetical protein DFA_10373 [Cavenderia fasciculata]
MNSRSTNMNSITTSTITSTSTTTTTFLTIFRINLIRYRIFQCFETLPFGNTREHRYRKGSDFIERAAFKRYALPWDFVKHYLDTLLSRATADSYLMTYCAHKNATVSTLLHLLDWIQPYLEQLPSTDMMECKMIDAAAKGGQKQHLDIVKMLHNRYTHLPFICTTDAIANASLNGDIEMVQFLLTNRTEGFKEDAVVNAASLGHIPLLKLFYQYSPHLVASINVSYAACKSGSVETVKYIDQFRHLIDYNDETNNIHNVTTMEFQVATNYGRLKVIEYLHENRTETLDENGIHLMEHACYSRNLDIVKFLHYNRTEGATDKAINLAIGNGDLEIVQFLFTNRAEINVAQALEKSLPHIEVFKFLYAHTPYHNATLVLTEAILYFNQSAIEFMLCNFDQNRIQIVERHWDLLKCRDGGRWDRIKQLYLHHKNKQL